MVWGYCFKAVSIVLPFIFRTAMIICLGADYLGINSLFTSVLQVLSLSELGFSSAMVYSMYKPIADNDTESICALLNFYKKIYRYIGTVMLGIGCILIPFIPRLISGTYPNDINIYFVYFIFLLNSSLSYFLFAYKGSLLNAYQRNDIESKILLLVSVIRYGIEIVGIYITRQYYLFLAIELLSTVIQNILKLISTNKLFPELIPRGSISSNQKKEIKTNVLALLCHKIGGTILNSADNIVLSAFMGVIIVANYGNYYYIMNAIEGIIIIVFTGLIGGIGNSFVTEETSKNRESFKKVLFFNAWIVCFCSACMICLYNDFMELWVGREYMFDNGIVILIVLYFFVQSIRRTILAFRDGAGMWKDNMMQPLVSAGVNLIVNIILVQIIGLAGILISSIGSMVFIDIPWETRKFCNRIGMEIRSYYILLLKYFTITVVCAGACWIVASFIHFSPIFNLLLKLLICCIIANLFQVIIYRKKPEYQYFVSLVKKYLTKVHV